MHVNILCFVFFRFIVFFSLFFQTLLKLLPLLLLNQVNAKSHILWRMKKENIQVKIWRAILIIPNSDGKSGARHKAQCNLYKYTYSIWRLLVSYCFLFSPRLPLYLFLSYSPSSAHCSCFYFYTFASSSRSRTCVFVCVESFFCSLSGKLKILLICFSPNALCAALMPPPCHKYMFLFSHFLPTLLLWMLL